MEPDESPYGIYSFLEMGTLTKNLASDILVRRGRNSEMSELLNEVAATNPLGNIEFYN